MQEQAAGERQETVASLYSRLVELCRQIDPEVEVTIRETVDVILSWGGEERHIEVAAERVDALRANPEILRQEVEAAVRELHQQVHPTDAALDPREIRMPDHAGPELLAPTPRERDREAIERVKELARHIVRRLEPEATITFEEYEWHGELTLDICVHLHGHEQHLEIGASRAHIILPDYEWKLRLNDLEDELLYHELEEVIHDLHAHARSDHAH
ncbi:MAG: hypothetical protein C4290_08970 [Chloroflexota bacterium]